MPSRRSFLRLTAFGILVIALVTLLTPLLRTRTEPVAQPGPLVVVSMPTLRWADVDERRTPTLDRLADDAAREGLAPEQVRPRQRVRPGRPSRTRPRRRPSAGRRQRPPSS